MASCNENKTMYVKATGINLAYSPDHLAPVFEYYMHIKTSSGLGTGIQSIIVDSITVLLVQLERDSDTYM